MQSEGAAAVGGRSPSVWDTFARQSGKIQDGSSPAVATDFYNKYKQDIALMKSMGVKNFRCVQIKTQQQQKQKQQGKQQGKQQQA
jgi:beta-glucosidase/6-phospho-beta-glucosidase/beta-galactosidase